MFVARTHQEAAAAFSGRSYQARDELTARTSHSITGTSISTPTTVARAAPDSNPYSTIATATADVADRVAAVIEAKKIKLSPEEARDLAKRAVKFKQERGRLPSLTSTDAWEKRMAEGVAFLTRMKQEAMNG